MNKINARPQRPPARGRAACGRPIAEFMGSFERVADLPHHGTIKEFAFIGRSNVGKSSLINVVTAQNIAKVSNTPGRTQSLNLFNMDDRIWIMDLPGYGWARISKDDQVRWLERLEEYLTNRAELAMLFILIDSRHGIKELDKTILDFARDEQIPHTVVYTKCDKKGACSFDGGIMTSSEKGVGIDKIKAMLG